MNWSLNVLAAGPVTEKCIDNNPALCAPSLAGIETIFGNAVEVLLGLAGVALFIMLIVGGFKYITAGGDPKGVESAQKTLTYAIGGLVLIVVGFLILRFISQFTNVDVTLFRIFQP